DELHRRDPGASADIEDAANTGRGDIVDQLLWVTWAVDVVVVCSPTKGIGTLTIGEQVQSWRHGVATGSRWHARARVRTAATGRARLSIRTHRGRRTGVASR